MHLFGNQLHVLNNRRPRMGFTLVELLVVIGVIAVLIGILLPVLNRARRQANQIVCMSNMRSTMQGVLLYTNAYNGWIPGGSSTNVWKPSIESSIENDLEGWPTRPIQNLDWVSPVLGRIMSLPSNDLYKTRELYGMRLRCPENKYIFTAVFGGSGGTSSWPAGWEEINYPSFSANLAFMCWPERAMAGYSDAISADKSQQQKFCTNCSVMLTPVSGGTFQYPSQYAPRVQKVGNPSTKVWILEGVRLYDRNPARLEMNTARWQYEGGGFAIVPPAIGFGHTPWSSFEGGKYIIKDDVITENFAFRHRKRMNVAFFDGHVETLAIGDIARTSYWVPKGTIIKTAQTTLDPADKNGNIVP